MMTMMMMPPPLIMVMIILSLSEAIASVLLMSHMSHNLFFIASSSVPADNGENTDSTIYYGSNDE